MRDAWRTDARLGESIVKPGRGEVPEVPPDRGVNGRQHLEQHEDDARRREWPPETSAALHRRDERAHNDRERRRQNAAQDEYHPPGRSE